MAVLVGFLGWFVTLILLKWAGSLLLGIGCLVINGIIGLVIYRQGLEDPELTGKKEHLEKMCIWGLLSGASIAGALYLILEIF